MNKLIFTLRIVYINRYRQLTYNDSSIFWILIIIYSVMIFKMLNGSFPSFPAFDYKEYLILYFSFMASQFVNSRTDWGLLNGLFNTKKACFIYFIDLFLVNVFNIIVSIYFGWTITLSIIWGLIIFFTFYKAKTNHPIIKFPLQILDIINFTQLRKYKMIYLIFVGSFYISYQGLIENNQNLYIMSIIGIIILLSGNSQKTEKLDYFILSKYNSRQYILRNELSFFVNCFLIISPTFILTLFIQPTYILSGLLCFLVIPITYPVKYIFLNHLFPIGMITMLIFISYISIIFDQIDWLLLCSIIPISYVLHYIAFIKFSKKNITANSEFYL